MRPSDKYYREHRGKSGFKCKTRTQSCVKHGIVLRFTAEQVMKLINNQTTEEIQDIAFEALNERGFLRR